MKRVPFILRPERKNLEAWRDVLVAKYGAAWLVSFEERMGRAGSELGIHFDFRGVVGNSLKSLRLLRWARRFNITEGDAVTTNVQELLADVLARYHFEEAATVGKEENLRRAVAEVNDMLEERSLDAFLPADMVEDLLSDHPLDVMIKEDAQRLLYTDTPIAEFVDSSRKDLCQELAIEVVEELRFVSAAGVSSIPVILFFLPGAHRPSAAVFGSATTEEFLRTILGLEKKAQM